MVVCVAWGVPNGKVETRQLVQCVIEVAAGISNEMKHIQWSHTWQHACSHKAVISKFGLVLSVYVNTSEI